MPDIDWKARAEKAEAALTALRAECARVLRPFAAVANLMKPLVEANPARWPDDKPNSEFIPGAWPYWSDFRAAAVLLATLTQAEES